MNQISDLIPNELYLPINTALHRAKRELKPVLYDGIYFHQRDVICYLNLEVIYFPRDTRVDAFFMVIIQKEKRIVQSYPVEKFQQEAEANQRILNLEYELELAHENLHSTIESLEVINEEQQATNEELIASNEELQSSNEELYAVNTEYQIKIRQLIELNNDIDNLMRSSEIGVIFLDRNLRIRKFTPLLVYC